MGPQIVPVPAPPILKKIKTNDILFGPSIPALERLQIMSDDEFEKVVLEWCAGFLTAQYKRVRQIGGAGDKGRDIIGFYSDGSIDVYQCKHYQTTIAPSQIYIEFGKLCYYTFKEVYPVPKKFVIVGSKGVGPELARLIANPKEINTKLKENWEKYCEKHIIDKQAIQLEDDFLNYVTNFNFSIITDKAPHELIAEHGKTRWHAARFGGGLIKYRDIIPEAEAQIQPRELNYTQQLFDVYSEELKKTVADDTALHSASEDLWQHFTEQRNSFYAAESLEVCSRENFPDADSPPFDDLKKETYTIASNNLRLNRDISGYNRLLSCVGEVLRNDFTSNPLAAVKELKAIDKQGVCHHLANDNKIKWKK